MTPLSQERSEFSLVQYFRQGSFLKAFMIGSAEVVFVSDKRRTELDILHPNKAVLPNTRNYLKRRQRHLDISHFNKDVSPNPQALI